MSDQSEEPRRYTAAQLEDFITRAFVAVGMGSGKPHNLPRFIHTGRVPVELGACVDDLCDQFGV